MIYSLYIVDNKGWFSLPTNNLHGINERTEMSKTQNSQQALHI